MARYSLCPKTALGISRDRVYEHENSVTESKGLYNLKPTTLYNRLNMEPTLSQASSVGSTTESTVKHRSPAPELSYDFVNIILGLVDSRSTLLAIGGVSKYLYDFTRQRVYHTLHIRNEHLVNLDKRGVIYQGKLRRTIKAYTREIIVSGDVDGDLLAKLLPHLSHLEYLR